ncbi:hypothetical protein [Robertkochia sediminum]|uniref:hypothetical protein n=1 Tax=Robertkochia sediminum TaxID=2785326 RepID=UPI0019316B4A|nr:hypothetical protein [Robertkochia sediminum]MBL7473101.1 hypothetical protein [Robertkochia sediminum]
MCSNVNQIKLCTCSDNTSTPDTNYWILYREETTDGIPFMVIGETIVPLIPEILLESQQKKLEDYLLDQLNDGSAFDFDLIPEHGDLLHLNITIPKDNNNPYQLDFFYSGLSLAWEFNDNSENSPASIYKTGEIKVLTKEDLR